DSFRKQLGGLGQACEIGAKAEADAGSPANATGGLPCHQELVRAVERDPHAEADRPLEEHEILRRPAEGYELWSHSRAQGSFELTAAKGVAPEPLLAEDPAKGER